MAEQEAEQEKVAHERTTSALNKSETQQGSAPDSKPVTVLIDDANDEGSESGASQVSEFAPALEPTPKPVTVHALEAADYTLKPLDFAAPLLNEVTALEMEKSYSLGSLSFSVPYVAPYVPGVWRVVWCNTDGRPPDIPPGKATDMIAKMKQRIVELQAAKRFKRIGREDPAVMAYARELAAEAGIETGNGTLLRCIVRPAFQSLEAED